MNILDSSVFDLSPIPLWVQDYSQVKIQFNIWRQQGVTDLRQFLEQDLSRVMRCAHKIKIIKANQKALEQLSATNLQQIRDNIEIIFQKKMLSAHITELTALWEGKTEFTSTTINYTLQGKAIDIKLRGVVLANHEEDLRQVLLSTEDISDYQQARRLAESRFIYSPCSLWMEDYSHVKNKFNQLRENGVEDFEAYLVLHPEFVQWCIDDIVLLDVNQATLDLFKAPNKKILRENLNTIFGYGTQQAFSAQLVELWKGNMRHQHEIINYTLDGNQLNILLQFTVFPEYEHDWSLVQIALMDITARKKAECYLKFLNKYDVLTNLFNRSFFTEELGRLENNKQYPVSGVYIDMNGLKQINDSYGHDRGDSLLKRLGNIINQSLKNTAYNASRIGGDEFVILMPTADQDDAVELKQKIEKILHINNLSHSDYPMSIAIGHATTTLNESIEDMLRRADRAMYQHKRRYYQINSTP